MRVLTIDRGIVDGIMAHARRDHPEEACGVVAGPIGSDRPERLIPMDNAERSMTFYRFDAIEQLRVWREMDDRDEEPVHVIGASVADGPTGSPDAVTTYMFGQTQNNVDYECPA